MSPIKKPHFALIASALVNFDSNSSKTRPFKETELHKYGIKLEFISKE
jgi:hypothetical protein